MAKIPRAKLPSVAKASICHNCCHATAWGTNGPWYQYETCTSFFITLFHFQECQTRTSNPEQCAEVRVWSFVVSKASTKRQKHFQLYFRQRLANPICSYFLYFLQNLGVPEQWKATRLFTMSASSRYLVLQLVEHKTIKVATCPLVFVDRLSLVSMFVAIIDVVTVVLLVVILVFVIKWLPLWVVRVQRFSQNDTSAKISKYLKCHFWRNIYFAIFAPLRSRLSANLLHLSVTQWWKHDGRRMSGSDPAFVEH